MKAIDMTGMRFGMWTVTSMSESIEGNSAFNCRCDCGNISIVRGSPLRRGKSLSCGCRVPSLSSDRGSTHGGVRTKAYRTWLSMKERCLVEHHKSYKYYGGKGVTIDKAWIHDFSAFLSDMGNPLKGQSIDRLDSNGSYNKENCKWSTAKEQARNRSSSHIVTYDGETKCIASWAEDIRCKVGYEALLRRVLSGWPLLLAMECPVRVAIRK